MGTQWAKLWTELNKRQRFYLQVIYALDQENEDYYKRKWSFYTRGYPPPASEWRWLLYGPVEPPTLLYTKIQKAGMVDPGTGSTFEALTSRGYIKKRYERDKIFIDIYILFVQITPKGRSLIRHGDPTYKPQPKLMKGYLTKSQWNLLKKLYEADEEGIETRKLFWPTALRLREYKPEALLREVTRNRQVRKIRDFWDSTKHGLAYTTYIETVPYYFVQITAYGKAYYESNREYYEGLHGEVKES